jgi:hypothetical protein
MANIPSHPSHAALARRSKRIAEAILDLAGRIPATRKLASSAPQAAARKLASAAATKAALISGGLALPPGPLGWIAILPDLIAIWKLQAQLVADIAALNGKSATLGREQMIYCLFKHAAAQAVRDLAIRIGERTVIRQVTLSALHKAAERIGVKVTQRALGSAAARWIPIAGAVGVGAYAYYDTTQVARTAIELFGREIESAQPLGQPRG